jgi:hypothetical protein
MEIKELLKRENINKIMFYDYKTSLLQNVFTVCVLLNTETPQIEARGVAICSVGDTFSKVEGKDKSFYRAVEALRRKKSTGRINPEGRNGGVTRKIFGIKPDQEKAFVNVTLKELYNINPNSKIVSIPSGKKKKFIVEIPSNYPIKLANKLFKYKSHYRPQPSNKMETKLLCKGASE